MCCLSVVDVVDKSFEGCGIVAAFPRETAAHVYLSFPPSKSDCERKES